VKTCSLVQKFSRKPIICVKTNQFPDYSRTCELGFNPLYVPYSSFGGGIAWVGFWGSTNILWNNTFLFQRLTVSISGGVWRFVPLVMVYLMTWHFTDITPWGFVCWVSQLTLIIVSSFQPKAKIQQNVPHRPNQTGIVNFMSWSLHKYLCCQ